MYFPYLWCRQEEVLAIVELVGAGVLSKTTVPILKPVDTKPTTEKRLERIVQGGGRIAVITDSDDGRPAPPYSAVKKMLDGSLLLPHAGSIFPAFELRGGMALGELKNFATGFTGRTLLVVHRDHTHGAAAVCSALGPENAQTLHVFVGRTIAALSSVGGLGSVLLRDDFRHQSPNGAYPQSSLFGDLVYQYPSLGHQGFGDFATVGDRSPTYGGGAAKHVALHLTTVASGNTLHCHHFKSGKPATAGDTAKKYLQALGALVAVTGTPLKRAWATVGAQEFYATHQSGHFPNLGKPKRWSIMHHIEVIQGVMAAAGAAPFI